MQAQRDSWARSLDLFERDQHEQHQLGLDAYSQDVLDRLRELLLEHLPTLTPDGENVVPTLRALAAELGCDADDLVLRVSRSLERQNAERAAAVQAAQDILKLKES